MESFIKSWLQLNEQKFFLNGLILESLSNENNVKFSFGFSKMRLACSYEIIKDGTLDFVIFDTDRFDSVYTDVKHFTHFRELEGFFDKYLDFFISFKDNKLKDD